MSKDLFGKVSVGNLVVHRNCNDVADFLRFSEKIVAPRISLVSVLTIALKAPRKSLFI